MNVIVETIKEDLKKYFSSDIETYNHSLRIAETFFDYNGTEKDDLIIVSLLHDVVEDEIATFEELNKYYDLSNKTMQALKTITRKKSEKYFDYINRIKTNSIAIKVKIHDLLDNINRNKNNHSFDSLRRRYYKALTILTS